MNSRESQSKSIPGQSLKTNLHPKSSPPANFTVKNISKPLAQYKANISKIAGSVGSAPKPAGSTPNPAGSTPNPAGSAPKPADVAKKGNIPIVENTRELESKLSDAGKKLVVIKFFATWCNACKMIAHKVDEMNEEFPNVIFIKVDVDEAEKLAEEYKVKAMPTFILIKKSRKVIYSSLRAPLHYECGNSKPSVIRCTLNSASIMFPLISLCQMVFMPHSVNELLQQICAALTLILTCVFFSGGTNDWRQPCETEAAHFEEYVTNNK